MKKYLLISFVFILSCVASGPHRYAIYWIESWELEKDKRFLQGYSILDDYITAHLDFRCEGRSIKIPKFTRLKFLRRADVKREKEGSTISCVLVEWEIIAISPIKTGIFYYEMSFRLSPGDKVYVLFEGSLSDYTTSFNETFSEYDPVTMFRLTIEDLDKIGKKEIGVNDREVLLHLGLGKPQKIVREHIHDVEYRRYYYSGIGFFYVLNGIIKMKSKTPYRIR